MQIFTRENKILWLDSWGFFPQGKVSKKKKKKAYFSFLVFFYIVNVYATKPWYHHKDIPRGGFKGSND